MNTELSTTRALGGNSRMTAEHVIDLPLPDSPTKSRHSPGAMAKEESLTTGISPPPRPTAIVKFRTLNSGGDEEAPAVSTHGSVII
jgi:hypothetical protein